MAIRMDDMQRDSSSGEVREVKSGGPTSCRGFFCDNYASNKKIIQRGNTNEALDERLRFIEEELLGVYPNEEMVLNDPNTWFRNERKICGYFPAIRIMVLSGVIMTIWSCLDFGFAMCLVAGEVIVVAGTLLTGVYAVWALLYDRVVEIPPTYTYFHRRTEMYGWCGWAFLAPLWYAYTVTLVLIAIFSVIIALALTYVEYDDLLSWSCDTMAERLHGSISEAKGRRLLELLLE